MHRRVADRPHRRIAHARTIRIVELAVFDFLHAREALLHHEHVRSDDRFAEAAELFFILLLDRREERLVGDAVDLQERRNAEKCAEERIALHAQLQIAAVGRFARDVEPGQDVNADIVLANELAVLRRECAARPSPAFRSIPRPGSRLCSSLRADWYG